MKAKEIVNICSEVDDCPYCELYNSESCHRFYYEYGAPWFYENQESWLE